MAGQVAPPRNLIADRHLREARPDIRLEAIRGDVASDSVAGKLRDCDFIFLAADSMRGRLVVNALTHQYLIPSVQMGSERLDRGGHVHSPAAEAGKGDASGAMG